MMPDLCIYYTIFNQVNYIYLFKHQFFTVKALRTPCSSIQSVQYTTVSVVSLCVAVHQKVFLNLNVILNKPFPIFSFLHF